MVALASLIAVSMSTITQLVSQMRATLPPPISVSVSTSSDYIMDGLTAFYSFLTLILAIIAFCSFRVTRKQSEAALNESRKQSEATLQVAREANAATIKTIEEMREARDQDSAPYVVASFEFDAPIIFFVVKNLGKSVATEIKLSIDPPFAIVNPSMNLNELSFLKDGIEGLVPGNEIRTFFASAITYFSNPDFPLKYKVTIAYRGGILPKLRWHETTLDLSAYKGLSRLIKRDFDDLAKEVEQIRKSFEELNATSKKMVKALETGIWIKNSEVLSINLNLEDMSCLSFIGAKLQEFKTKWQVIYGKTMYPALNEIGKELVDPDDSNTRNDCLLLGQQILFALSKCRCSLPGEFAEKITQVAVALFALGKMEAYRFGEDRTDDFNATGEKALRDVEDISKLIENYVTQSPQLEQK